MTSLVVSSPMWSASWKRPMGNPAPSFIAVSMSLQQTFEDRSRTPLDAGVSTLMHSQRLHEDGDEKAIDDEAGCVLHRDTLLADRSSERSELRENSVACRLAPHHLNQVFICENKKPR